MIPSVFVFLESLPLTPNGKSIDAIARAGYIPGQNWNRCLSRRRAP